MESKALIKIEDSAMSLDAVVAQVSLIQQLMKTVLKEGEHYGTIPGTDKPTLYKPGAEKLCLTFRLEPDYEIIREVREQNFIAYTIKCRLHPMEVTGIGSCNSRETKYRYRSQNTGKSVPQEYWKNRDSAILGGSQYTVRKKDKQWFIFEQIENENPWDLDNTIIKMACKRSLTAATLNATAASDIFTQDLEDLQANGIIEAEIVEETETTSSEGQNPPKKAKTHKTKGTPPGEPQPTFIEIMADLQKNFESMDQLDAFQEALRIHEAKYDDEQSAYSYESISDRKTQEALYNSLQRYLKTVKDKGQENSQAG